MARKLEAGHLVIVSAAVVGMIGAFAGKILSGQVLVDGNLVLAGPGEPLGAFAAAYLAIEIGILISGKTKLDIILTPLVCIGTGSAVGLFVGPPISEFMFWLLDQLGNRAAAVFDGNCRFRFNGNDPDASDQLSGAWSNPESVGTGGRGGDDRMLL